MFGKKVIVLAGTILAISLWGCSADFEAEKNQTSGEAGTAVVDNSSVGAGNCIGCHEILDIANSTTVVADYLAGKHVIHSTHVSAADDCALKCHDPFGDGQSLKSFIEVGGPYDATLIDPTLVSPTGDNSLFIPENGLAAVTCETCHGAGADHVNGAAIPYKTPDYNRCGQCHNADFFHDKYGHNGEEDNIVEDYTASKHLSGAIRNLVICVKCHTDEGARKYKDVDIYHTDFAGDPPDIRLSETLPVAESNSIQCRTCHNPHNNGKLLKDATDAPVDPTTDPPEASAEYNTCTNCHQRHDATIGASISSVGSSTSDGSSGQLIFHAGYWDRVISSTHWDDPATPDFIEGYVINPKSERACRDCHNVHGADATINKQWASSAHGSKIRDAKEAAAALPAASPIAQVTVVRAAGADNTHALPHYDWDDTTGISSFWSKAACQRCHTSTGAKNYLTDIANYDHTGAGNDFSHLEGWVAGGTSSGQNELIYCWACHSDNSGALRDPGAVTLEYTVSSSKVALPDLGKSNLCATCHGGLGNNDSIRAARSSRFAGHHFAAAGTMYSSFTHFGYEFSGQNYTDQSYFRHSRIGTDVTGDDEAKFSGAIALVGTTTGPCVSCHMPEANHSLNAVENGTITNQALCNTCHAKYGPMTATKIEEASLEYQNASTLLNAYLTNSQPNYLLTDITVDYATVAEEAYGAYQNGKLATEEPAGFAHNSYYVKRLIFDSIDWLDNGVLDGTITIPSPTTTYLEAFNWLGETRPAHH